MENCVFKLYIPLNNGHLVLPQLRCHSGHATLHPGYLLMNIEICTESNYYPNVFTIR